MSNVYKNNNVIIYDVIYRTSVCSDRSEYINILKFYSELGNYLRLRLCIGHHWNNGLREVGKDEIKELIAGSL